MSQRLYLAYGSNLSTEQMANRCPDAIIYGKTDIEDYQLMFKKSGTGFYATIEPAKGASVPAVVWTISEDDELNLDRCEGYPRHYQKVDIDVKITSIEGDEEMGLMSAMAYVLPEERHLGAPTEVYYNRIAGGYEVFGFDLKVLEKAFEISDVPSEEYPEELPAEE